MKRRGSAAGIAKGGGGVYKRSGGSAVGLRFRINSGFNAEAAQSLVSKKIRIIQMAIRHRSGTRKDLRFGTLRSRVKCGIRDGERYRRESHRRLVWLQWFSPPRQTLAMQVLRT